MKCYKVMSNTINRTCKIFKNIYTEGSFKNYLFLLFKHYKSVGFNQQKRLYSR